MEKWWLNSMLVTQEFEPRCRLSKYMGSRYPIDNTSRNENPSLNYREKKIHSWSNSNVDLLFGIRDIRNFISDDTFLVRDSKGDTYSIYFDSENQIFDIQYDTKYSLNKHIASCIDIYLHSLIRLHSQMHIETSFLSDNDNYTNSYVFDESKNSPSTNAGNNNLDLTKDYSHLWIKFNMILNIVWISTLPVALTFICILIRLHSQMHIETSFLSDNDNYTNSYVFDESKNSPSTNAGNNNLDLTKDYSHLWIQCENCYELNYKKFLKSKLHICKECGYHLQMSSSDRIELLIDRGTWDPLDEDMVSLDPIEFHSSEEPYTDSSEEPYIDLSEEPYTDLLEEPYTDSSEEPYTDLSEEPYTDRINSYQEETGLTEAVQTGIGQLNGIPLAIGVMDFQFIGGSMGSVVGEKITRLIEYATNQKLPLIIVCASEFNLNLILIDLEFKLNLKLNLDWVGVEIELILNCFWLTPCWDQTLRSSVLGFWKFWCLRVFRNACVWGVVVCETLGSMRRLKSWMSKSVRHSDLWTLGSVRCSGLCDIRIIGITKSVRRSGLWTFWCRGNWNCEIELMKLNWNWMNFYLELKWNWIELNLIEWELNWIEIFEWIGNEMNECLNEVLNRIGIYKSGWIWAELNWFWIEFEMELNRFLDRLCANFELMGQVWAFNEWELNWIELIELNFKMNEGLNEVFESNWNLQVGLNLGCIELILDLNLRWDYRFLDGLCAKFELMGQVWALECWAGMGLESGPNWALECWAGMGLRKWAELGLGMLGRNVASKNGSKVRILSTNAGNNNLDLTKDYSHLWIQCENCYELNYKKFLKSKLHICKECGYHLQMSSSDRIELLIDRGTWDPLDEDMVSLDPIEFHSSEEPYTDSSEEPYIDLSEEPYTDLLEEPYTDSSEEPYTDLSEEPYTDRINSYQEETGLTEAVQTGIGQLNGIPLAIGVMDFQFIGGSMGSVVGEKITRLIEYATNQKLPLIIVCASGGARMQEGSLSLMQMAKISSVLYDYQSNNKLFYVSILTSPTTGGVTASFGMLGDIIISEPNAYIAFAGKRVIEETLNTTVPEGSQEAEYLFDKGLFDLIVPRNLLKEVLSELFQLHAFFPSNLN
uniref:Acetyl-coenzyme A carboxylase carboxyl transferase subunit beta, chloroplastic n=2 Tax=Limonium TaxID=46093 RepID=A0A6M9ZWN1_9CARY|nr:acetyl-CoA carboxylase carboxyltransferase beta subunit [Limonium sinense]